MAKAVCTLMEEDLVQFVYECKQQDPKLWLSELIDAVSHSKVVRVLVTRWSIWWDRSKAIHDQQF